MSLIGLQYRVRTVCVLIRLVLCSGFCGGSLKDCTKAVMNCLFSNPRVMPFLSMHGRNYGKVVFRRTNICGLVVGKSNKFPTLWLVVEFFKLFISV